MIPVSNVNDYLFPATVLQFLQRTLADEFPSWSRKLEPNPTVSRITNTQYDENSEQMYVKHFKHLCFAKRPKSNSFYEQKRSSFFHSEKKNKTNITKEILFLYRAHIW